MISSEQVGKRISMLRKEKQLSQEQLAERLNVSAQAVSKWETGKSLPETTTLPLLSHVLGHSIDSILMPQELVILTAIYTDGLEDHDVTHFVNQFVVGNRLTLTVCDQIFPNYMDNDRTKLLLIKYQTPTGIYSTYIMKDNLLSIDIYSKEYTFKTGELEYLFASYGNELNNQNVLKKMKHYHYFKWDVFTANHELFPSHIDNSNDYLLLVYLNDSGIHAISCSEGEQIHYSPDRTHLFKSEAPNDYYIVEDVPPLGFGKGIDCSWAGAFYQSLKIMKFDTTYDTVMGVSGACWRIAFEPVWDYSSVDALVAYDYATPAFKAYGLKASWADRIKSEERKIEIQSIMENIRNHQLPIAINLRVAPEWGVITGYLDNGNTLLCRSYFDDETFEDHKDDPEFQEYMKVSKGYLNVDHWPYLLIRFSEQVNIPSTWDSLQTSLRIKIDSMNFGENRGYTLGYKALDVWREGLLEEHWFQTASDEDFVRRLGVNHFCMMALVDARRSASTYLNDSLSLLQNDSGIESLTEMAEVYEQIHALLDNFFNTMNHPDSLKADLTPKQSWTSEQRKQQAGLLQSIISLEYLGDELARRILGALEN